MKKVNVTAIAMNLALAQERLEDLDCDGLTSKQTDKYIQIRAFIDKSLLMLKCEHKEWTVRDSAFVCKACGVVEKKITT